MDEQTTTETESIESPIKRWTIQRDGNRPLCFLGERIGEGESGSGGTSGYRRDWNRGVKVRIYRRKAGGYVVTRHYWSQWQGERGRYEAMVCATPAAVFSQLSRGPEGDDLGEIGRAELEALHEAASCDDGIDSVAVEDLDGE